MTHADGGKRYFVSEKDAFEHGGHSMWGPEKPLELVPASDYALLEQQVEELQGEIKRLTTLLADRIDVVWEAKLRETQHRAEQAEARVKELEDKQ